jgi:hypothetical protein
VYDKRERLLDMITKNGSTQDVLAHVRYTHDEEGNRVSMSNLDLQLSYQWGLDGSYRLVSEDFLGNCADDLQVEVMFSGASDGRMQIEPPYGSEWLVTSIDRGEVRLEISPPRLTRMVDRMADSVKISLNWKIRDASTQRVLRAGEAGIEIRDDPA